MRNHPSDRNDVLGPKKERLSPRITEAIRLIADGECRTQKAAALRVGINQTHLCEELKKPKYQSFIAEKTRRMVSEAQLPAARVLLDLLEGGESEHARKDIAFRLLAISGIAPAERPIQITNNVQTNLGYVVDWRSGRRKDGGDGKTLEAIPVEDNPGPPDAKE